MLDKLNALFTRVKAAFFQKGADDRLTQKLSREKAVKHFIGELGDFADAEIADADVAQDVTDAIGEQEPSFFSQARPLGEILGFVKVVIDDKAVMDTAKRGYKRSPEFKTYKQALGLTEEDKDPKILTVPWTWLREPLMGAYQAGAIKADLGKDFAKTITPEQCFGKGHLGWVLVPGKTDPLDLCGLNWRMSDWTRPQVVPMTPEEGIALNTLGMTARHFQRKDGPKVKELLGDGVDFIVKPSVLGLPEDHVGFFQNRALVKAPNGTIVTLYKGIGVVHPQAEDILAYPDGYGWDVMNTEVHGIGPDGNGARLHVYNMLDGNKFNPRSRYTLQGLYYQGREHWARALLSIENIKLAASGSDVMLEDRMMRANVPIKALGGWGVILGLTRLLKLTVVSGKARIALPAEAFQFMGRQDMYDALSRTYTSRVTGRQIHGFYAPASMRKYFEAAGGVGSEWALNRRPDLPTGACVQRHVLLGYTEFNAFVVNSVSMKASGLDFDGDMICCFPTVERSGLYVCFNDLPEDEMARREKASAGLDRKGQDKRDYDNGFDRHCGAIACTGILGPADITARKFGDLGLWDKAWAMVPWIQASVDMQKRDMVLPDPRGAMFMPKVSIDSEKEVCATTVLRALQKGMPDDDDATDAVKATYTYQWQVFKFKVTQLYLMSKLGSPSYKMKLHAPTPEMGQLIARYGFELGSRMAQAIGELDVYRANGVPLMRKMDYPARPTGALLDPRTLEHEGLRRLVQSVRVLDQNWAHLTERAKSDKALKMAMYAMKDGLLDVGIQKGLLGTMASAISSWPVFQMFADEQAFRDYFAQPQFKDAKRLSDLFSVLDEQSFSLTEVSEGVKVHTNPKPVYIGLHQYDAGDVRISRAGPGELKITARHREFADLNRVKGIRLGKQVATFKKGSITYTTRATNIQDALLELRFQAAGHLLAQGRMLHPQQLAVEELFAAKRDQDAKQAEPAAPAVDTTGMSPEQAFIAGAAALLGQPTPEVAEPVTEDEARDVLNDQFKTWGGLVTYGTMKATESAPEDTLFAHFSAFGG